MWILLVEDNPGDVRLLREGFREAGVEIDLQVAEDGERALEMLQRQAWPPGKLGCPNLILLDLNLPKVDGKGVLAALKADPNLRRIPVIILSSSRDSRDILGSYDLFANCYISKPSSFDGCVRVARGISDFWIGVASLPEHAQYACG